MQAPPDGTVNAVFIINSKIELGAIKATCYHVVKGENKLLSYGISAAAAGKEGADSVLRKLMMPAI
jgi:hypothetical protein